MEATHPTPSRPLRPTALAPSRSLDRATVERTLAEIELQRVRLQAELAAAQSRLAAAEAWQRTRDEHERAELADLVRSATRDIAGLDAIVVPQPDQPGTTS